MKIQRAIHKTASNVLYKQEFTLRWWTDQVQRNKWNYKICLFRLTALIWLWFTMRFPHCRTIECCRFAVSAANTLICRPIEIPRTHNFPAECQFCERLTVQRVGRNVTTSVVGQAQWLFSRNCVYWVKFIFKGFFFLSSFLEDAIFCTPLWIWLRLLSQSRLLKKNQSESSSLSNRRRNSKVSYRSCLQQPLQESPIRLQSCAGTQRASLQSRIRTIPNLPQGGGTNE